MLVVRCACLSRQAWEVLRSNCLLLKDRDRLRLVWNDGQLMGISHVYSAGLDDLAGRVRSLASSRRVTHRVLILLSTYNGAAYLPEQLQSLAAQSHTEWTLYWRDDGSTDDTLAIMSKFADQVGSERCVRISDSMGRLWPTASFVALLRAALPSMAVADYIAFADQDDVWLPDKLTRGVRAMAAVDQAVPTLYCARLAAVDHTLRYALEISLPPRRYGFPACLTQNVAIGCTTMLNSAAAQLIAGSVTPAGTFHDWWSYILVAAAGGRILVDDNVVVLYRLHSNNYVGMPRSQLRRAVAAIRRGPSAFMNILRQHVESLVLQRNLADEANYRLLLHVQAALRGNLVRRLAVLRLPGLRRQQWLETLLFRIWFLIG